MGYSEFVSRYSPKRSRGSGSRIPVDPATQLHDLTVKLFDKGDGHGANWAEGAEALFRCAFAFLRNIPADSPAVASIARRAHDAAYNLMAGSEDSDAAYTAANAKPSRPAFTMADPVPGHDPSR